MTTEIKFKTKRQSICRDACGTVRTGACGESFVGKFRCSYKSNCSSENYCICSVRAFCKKNTIQKQVYEKTISFRARSRLVPRVMITSEPTTPEPDTPDYGALSTPEPDRQESETPTIPEPRTPDTPEQEDNKTKSRLEKRKKIFKAFRSMLLPRISATPEPDTPVSGKPTSPEPDTPESVTPTTPEPDTPEPGSHSTSEPDRPEPGTPDTQDPEPDTPDYGELSTPEPDRPESETPTIPEPGKPDTTEQEDNKTKSRLGKRKKLFKAFRSMLLPATPEPHTPVSGKPTSPEPDTPESVTPTTQDPGTPEIVESKGDIKIKKNDRTKSKLEKVRKLKNFILCTYNNMTMVISKHFRRSIFRKSFAKK